MNLTSMKVFTFLETYFYYYEVIGYLRYLLQAGEAPDPSLQHFLTMNRLGKPLTVSQAGEAPDPSLQHFFDYEQAGEAADPFLQHVLD